MKRGHSWLIESSKSPLTVHVATGQSSSACPVGLEPERKLRYNERTTVERTNSDLKDNYGGRHVRVKGHLKVFCHLMFGVIAITVKQLFNMLN